MATLTQRVLDLSTALGTKLKALNVMITGTAAGTLASLSTTDKSSIIAAINELDAAIENFSGVNDASNSSTTESWSIDKIQAELLAVKNSLLGGAGAAYDTLQEIQAFLEGDASELASLLTAVNNRVRFDAAQTLTSAEKLQARENIDAQSRSGVGFNDDNFVTTLNTAMA